MGKKKITYEEAFNELNEILKNLEGGHYSIDDLKIVLKRTDELAAYCRTILTETETEIKNISKNY